MRGLAWFLALLGVAQYGIIAWRQPDGYVSVDTAYIVMALFVLGAAAIYAFSWACCGWGWGDDCDCDHCEGCSKGDCCGHCSCYEGHGPGHEGHAHEGEHTHAH